MAKKKKAKIEKEEIVFDPSNEAARLAHIKRKLAKRAKKKAEREAKTGRYAEETKEEKGEKVK